MSFGWSAGDIVAAGRFLVEVAQALDEVDGAAKEFREASSFLHNLNLALKQLETLSALEAKPVYKQDIEREVTLIRTPVESFIKDVRSLQLSLGVVKEGKLRYLQNIPSKLKWHFSTSKKAFRLQKEIDTHLRIIDTLMQRLTVDMLDTLHKAPKEDVGKRLDEKLNTQLPVFQATLLSELSRCESFSQTARTAELRMLLEDLLENYLGSQRLFFRHSPAPSDSSLSGPTLLNTVSHLSPRYQADILTDCAYPIDGVTADSEIISRIQEWWTSGSSGILWAQTGPQEDFENHALASDVIALTKMAGTSVIAYFCQRLDADGQAPNQLEILANMMYSLVYQIAKYLAADGEPWASSDMMEVASKLDGSSRSLPHALQFIRMFLAVESRHLLLVLDGLEILEYSNDANLEEHLRGLYRVLRKCEPRIKTLMTTNGHSEMISDEVGWENTVDSSMGNESWGFFSLDEFKAGCDLGSS